MKKITNFIAAMILWLWSNILKSAVTKIVIAPTECAAAIAKKVDSAITKVFGDEEITFKKVIYHLDNIDGRYLQKILWEKGIIVMLYSLVKSKGKGKHAKYFMLMSHMNPVIIATLDAPEDAEGRAKLGEKIQLKGAGTTYITIPAAQLLALTDLIKAVRDAVGPEQTETAWDNLNGALKEIMAMVQTYMNHHRDVAEICCVFYGFKVRGKGGSHAQEWGGVTGTVTGSIDLTFEVIDGGCTYDILLWDRLHTAPPLRAQPTDMSKATVPDLVSGTQQAVSYNAIKGGKVVFQSGIIDVPVK